MWELRVDVHRAERLSSIEFRHETRSGLMFKFNRCQDIKWVQSGDMNVLSRSWVLDRVYDTKLASRRHALFLTER